MTKDISEVPEEQYRIFENEEIYRLIMEHTRDVIRVIDVDLNFVYVSPSHEMLLGYTSDEITHRSVLEILHPDDRDIAISMHQELISQNTSLDGLFRFKCKNGQWIYLETRGKSLVKDGKIVGVVTVGRDVTERLRLEQELRENQEQLEFLAFHDSLTKLPNRTLFFDRTAQAVEDAKLNGHAMAIMFIDCDDFKSINDTYGHDVGDEVIKEMGRRISSSVHKNDTVARLSGDEFTVLLSHINTETDVVEVASRIIQSTYPLWDISGNELHLTVSIGVAMNSSEVNTQTLMKHADEALYDAKEKGKNTFIVYRSGNT